MNANHSFRISITVLTVATIVGCVVMLLSGISQFRFLPAGNDKALVSTVNQKLRNRFGEFYPVEQRVPATAANSAATSVIRDVSQSSTYDEVVTTTSEYDNSEVITSWSSGTNAGVPQVSVPVTINVNNGELMAQLIETRESLAEVKAQQSAIRQDQRVFSYQVHKAGPVAAANSSSGSNAAATAAVAVTSSDSESFEPSASGKTETPVASQEKNQAALGGNESSFETTLRSFEAQSASPTVAGRSTSRMRSISETGSVHQATQSKPPALPSRPESSASEAKRATKTASVKNSVQATEVGHDSEFVSSEEVSSEADRSGVSIEEEISFEPIPQPTTPPAEEEQYSVPVIEPISYNVEETVEESRSVSVDRETVVQFGSLDSEPLADVPAALPALSFEEPKAEEARELPVLSLDQETTAAETRHSSAPAISGKPSEEPNLPTFFNADENVASKQTQVVSEAAVASRNSEKHRRTREHLASAFAPVRGVPPEDLFGDRSVPFVMPIEPAEPVNELSTPSLAFADSESEAEARSSTNMPKSAPPTISFEGSTAGSLVVHPSSAASPLELEYGAPSAPTPALAHGENPGAPESPVMLPAEPKPERWHKYRSRIHMRQNLSPSTPVPPVPELAGTVVPDIPASSFQEPAPVPPAAEDSTEEAQVESSVVNSDSERTISDSPLMIPDEDGKTEVAQNSDSEKLDSSTLPPVPRLAAVPELAPVPELKFHTDAAPTYSNPVYEPQPMMDRLNEVTTEMNTPPVFSASPPMMAQRTMPQKSASKLPFETTFRRINKRVAWMADALSPPEKKTAQQKRMAPKPLTQGHAQPSPHPPTQRHGQAVAKKKSASTPMQLPKFTVPRFTVQNFALPNVNFRAIQAPSFQMPMLDTPDWLACPPDVMAPVRNSTAVHRVMSTMQFVGQPKVLN